jgi:hypothetical protein
MYTPVDQKQIDQKIHQFMARKSVIKTISKTIADKLSPADRIAPKSETEISYEKLSWHHTGEALFSSRFQKAH